MHTYAVSAPLKLSRDWALTILFSSLFHAVGVLTKNEFLYVSVLANGICICMSFFFLVLLSGKYVMYLSAGIPTIPFCILNNMFNLFLSLLFSSVSHFKSANIWVTLLLLLKSPTQKRAAFLWIPSSLFTWPVLCGSQVHDAYSSKGLTNVEYAVVLTSLGQNQRFLLKNPSVRFALAAVLPTCSPHESLLSSWTPR